MAEYERKYADKPLHFFHIMSGENLPQLLDYKKHYRSDALHLADPNYAVGSAYNAGSWPCTVLVGPDGNLAGRWVGLSNPTNKNAALSTLDDLLGKAQGGPPKGAYCTGNVCYVRSAKDVFESAPTMAADGQGRLHVVYVHETGGAGDLFHRTLRDGQWTEPQRVTTSAADDYSPALCSDGRNGLWLAWCSNRAASGKYDVYAKHWTGGEWAADLPVTECNDDAAHPRAAVDTKGNLWVTYYKWISWSPGVSRDREIFVRSHDGQKWSDELQISPTDVPQYEDHADPSVAADTAGNVWVTWAWDTHPKEDAWPFPPTFGSAVFARQLRAGQPPSRLEFVAMRATSIAAAMRDPTFAFLPEIVCRGDQPWFAFESHSANGNDQACTITTYETGKGFPAPTRLGLNNTFVCTPRLVDDRHGGLQAIWSAPIGAHYAVHAARLGSDGQWDTGKPLWGDQEADLRFAAAAVDADHRLWIAAVRTIAKGSTVELRSFPPAP